MIRTIFVTVLRLIAALVALVIGLPLVALGTIAVIAILFGVGLVIGLIGGIIVLVMGVGGIAGAIPSFDVKKVVADIRKLAEQNDRFHPYRAA